MRNQCIIDLTPQLWMTQDLMIYLWDWFISDIFLNAHWFGLNRCGALRWGPSSWWFPPTIWCLNIRYEVCFALLWRFKNRRSDGVNIPWQWARDTRERLLIILKTWWSFIGIRSTASDKMSLNIFWVNCTTAIRIIWRQCIIKLTPQCCTTLALLQALGDIPI